MNSSKTPLKSNLSTVIPGFVPLLNITRNIKIVRVVIAHCHFLSAFTPTEQIIFLRKNILLLTCLHCIEARRARHYYFSGYLAIIMFTNESNRWDRQFFKVNERMVTSIDLFSKIFLHFEYEKKRTAMVLEKKAFPSHSTKLIWYKRTMTRVQIASPSRSLLRIYSLMAGHANSSI